MFVKAEKYRSENSTERSWGRSGVTAIVAAAVFAIALAAPVTIDRGDGGLTKLSMQSAFAKGGNGGGNGGGGGGNGGGGNGGNGGGNGGGNSGGGDAGPSGGNNGDDGRDIGVDNNAARITEDNRIWPVYMNRGPKITRAVFTTEIRDRSPQDDIRELHDPDQYVTFFTDLRKMGGKQVTHRWIYRDVVKYEMSFNVMSDSWQAWSTQRLPADLPGEWTVEVIDENGKVLVAENLNYLTTASDQPVQDDSGTGGFSDAVGKIRGLLKL